MFRCIVPSQGVAPRKCSPPGPFQYKPPEGPPFHLEFSTIDFLLPTFRETSFYIVVYYLLFFFSSYRNPAPQFGPSFQDRSNLRGNWRVFNPPSPLDQRVSPTLWSPSPFLVLLRNSDLSEGPSSPPLFPVRQSRVKKRVLKILPPTTPPLLRFFFRVVSEDRRPTFFPSSPHFSSRCRPPKTRGNFS